MKRVKKQAALEIIAKAQELAFKGFMVGWIAAQLAEEFHLDDGEAYSVAEDAGLRVALGRK